MTKLHPIWCPTPTSDAPRPVARTTRCGQVSWLAGSTGHTPAFPVSQWQDRREPFPVTVAGAARGLMPGPSRLRHRTRFPFQPASRRATRGVAAANSTIATRGKRIAVVQSMSGRSAGIVMLLRTVSKAGDWRYLLAVANTKVQAYAPTLSGRKRAGFASASSVRGTDRVAQTDDG